MCDKRKLSEEDNDSQDSDRACGIQDTISCIANSDKTLVEKKIRKIIEQHFDEEIDYKRHELEKINERIFEAQNMLDKLRVCIVCNFYSSNGQIALNDYINHPAVASLRCEHLEAAITHSKSLYEPGTKNESNEAHEDSNRSSHHQFDSKICVGNVSKYLNNKKIDSQLLQNDVESSQYNQDLITHKWMIYIRSPNCPKLDNYIK
ncbi:YEATS domain-containing 2 isoform X1, partial [Brachionus plicatilis]